MTSKTISKFVLDFISAHDGADFEAEWTSKKNQNSLKKLLVKKAPKDKNYPKRGKSSYLFFCADERESVKSDNPKFTAKEITVELGARWKKLKAKGGKKVGKYEKLAEADRKRYEDEKAAYVPPEGSEVKPKGPKRCKSSYLFFCTEMRPRIKKKNPKLSAKEITTELGVQWNKLKADKSRSSELKEYLDLASADRVRYDNEKAAAAAPASAPVEAEEPVEKKSSKKKVVKKAKKKVKVTGGKAVAKAPGKELTGYKLFCSENRSSIKDNNPKLKAKEVTKELSKRWKSLSTDEKDAYN